jgi:hypothetical protein
MRRLALSFGFVLIATVGRPAHADALGFQLTPATLSTSPGGAVEFMGTLTNRETSDVFLNGDVSILPYPDLMVDDSPFFTFSPLFLAGGYIHRTVFLRECQPLGGSG